MPTFAQLKISSAARPIVDRVLARATNDVDRKRIEGALVNAAGADLNKVLSANEVQAVADAFIAAATGALTPDLLGVGIEGAHVAITSMSDLGNLDGVSNVFTLQGKSVEARMVKELQDSVVRANGRPMDVNMLIFEFQSDVMQQAITDIARQNPNVTFRVIADSGQATASGGNALPELAKLGLPNIQVKFKKDFPYVWSSTLERPAYNHGATQGLNHHKGFVTFIDGKPDSLLTGSFNWSATADTKNYEDLTIFQNKDSSSRRAVEQFGGEFAGYWNNPEAALSPNAFQNYKGTKWNEMMRAHNKPATSVTNRPDDAFVAYTVPSDTRSLDVNGFRVQDETRLATLLGSKTLARSVIQERTKYGRFTDAADLKERVPQLASLTDTQLQDIGFGSGQVSINTASLEELDKVGLTKTQATALVAFREKNGDFESIDELIKVGVPKATITRLRHSLTAVDVEAFFNSRPAGSPAGGTGYGPDGIRQALVAGADGVVSPTRASVTVAATDLFNRAKAGDPISVAMYGASPTAPEFVSLLAAARRGAVVRVVLENNYTAPAAAALKALAAQGYPVEVRIQKAKTMHEKFGVVGNDVFFGSANFSESSSTKHSENRITVKNHQETASMFQNRFDEIWGKSVPG
ncbi:MAG: phospholipase D-like domain-containing protein [Archangium sp.]|nr:phospholipase D-like domain-containing protein [Archangium sp.]MDP3571254.1 phospholipase D-like domain-containing protein [Archangium sp.]